jgi:hypothetical protein
LGTVRGVARVADLKVVLEPYADVVAAAAQ